MSTRRWFAASALLAFCLAPAAHAGDELYLRWDNCLGDGGVYNKVFACDTNAGSEVLVGSFRLAQNVDRATDFSTDVSVIPLAQALPSWWQFVRAGTCRQSSLNVSFAAPSTSTACLDPWSSHGVVGFFDFTPAGVIKTVEGVPAGSEFPLTAGQEYFGIQVRIDHARTVGQGACGGCTAPVCIAWTHAAVGNGTSIPVDIFGHNTPDHDWNVTWQPGGVITVAPFDGFVSCESVTPARSYTWGSIKSLYR